MDAIIKKGRLKQLLEVVESGWEIDAPVLFGKMWDTSTNGNGNTEVYHFILRKKSEGKTVLISLPSSPALQVFLSENNIPVRSLL